MKASVHPAPDGLELILLRRHDRAERLRRRIAARGNMALVLVGAGERARRMIKQATQGVDRVQYLAGGINATGHPRWFAVIGEPRKVVRIHDYIPPPPGARIRLWIDFEKVEEDSTSRSRPRPSRRRPAGSDRRTARAASAG
jgi:hypothetical protein